MKKNIGMIIISVVLISLSSCASTKIGADQSQKIAIISMSANNYGKSVAWDLGDSLIWDQVNLMQDITEQEFSKNWTVIPAADFASSADFQTLAGAERKVAVPTFDEEKLPLFGEDRDDMISCSISSDKLAKIDSIIHADYYAVIYSEWTTATGKMIPTTKPLTKNVIQIYDATGASIYKDRFDIMGDKTLGAMGLVYVDDVTIGHWTGTYEEAIKTIVEENK